MPAPCDVNSISTGLSPSSILLKPKSVILASKVLTPRPSNMFPAHERDDTVEPVVLACTWLEVKVDDGGLDFVEVFKSGDCLNYDCS